MSYEIIHNPTPPTPRKACRTHLDDLVSLAKSMQPGEAVLLSNSDAQTFRVIMAAQGFKCATDGWRSNDRSKLLTFKLEARAKTGSADKISGPEDASWEPCVSQLNYVRRVIEGLCALWPDDQRQHILRQITEDKLNKFWPFVYKLLPVGHEMICAQVFWDALVCCYPVRTVCTIEAYFGEQINFDKLPHKVVLYVTPARVGERIQLNLRSE